MALIKITQLLCVMALVTIVSLRAAMAQNKAASSQTVITSDQMVFDYKKHVAEFKGHVVADDGTMLIKSDKMIVYFGETNQVQAIKADGNVQIHSEDKDGSADVAIYRAKDSSVQLQGDAKVARGAESVSGSEIVIWLNDDRMVVKKGSRLVMNTDSGSGVKRAAQSKP
jgi:lipopolysaccharide export system protein LptA